MAKANSSKAYVKTGHAAELVKPKANVAKIVAAMLTAALEAVKGDGEAEAMTRFLKAEFAKHEGKSMNWLAVMGTLYAKMGGEPSDGNYPTLTQSLLNKHATACGLTTWRDAGPENDFDRCLTLLRKAKVLQTGKPTPGIGKPIAPYGHWQERDNAEKGREVLAGLGFQF